MKYTANIQFCYILKPNLFKIHFNIILLHTLGSPKWFLSFLFYDQGLCSFNPSWVGQHVSIQWILFAYVPCNDAVTVWGCIAMNNLIMNLKGWGRKWSWLNWCHHLNIILWEMRKDMKDLKIIFTPTEIATVHLPDKSHKFYHLSHLLSNMWWRVKVWILSFGTDCLWLML